MKKPVRTILVSAALICASLYSGGCTAELTDPRDRPIARGPKAPLPDDPEGKRLDPAPKRAKTKLGRWFDKTWKQLPDLTLAFDPTIEVEWCDSRSHDKHHAHGKHEDRKHAAHDHQKDEGHERHEQGEQKQEQKQEDARHER